MNSSLILHGGLFAFYTGIFLWIISRIQFFEIGATSRNRLALFFLLKVAAGIALTLVYTYYYTDHAKADIYRYFNDSKVISSLLFTHPGVWLQVMTGTGLHDAKVFVYVLPTLYFSHPTGDVATNNSFIIRLVSLMNYLSFSDIYINTLFFDFISFVGLMLLFKTMRNYIPGLDRLLFIPLFLIPSVIFWASGLLKEGILLFGIGIYLRYAIKWGQTGKKINILWVIIGLLIVAWLKIYIAALLVLCSVFLPVPVSPVKRVAVYALVLFIGAWFTGSHFCEQIIDKRNEFIALSITENAGSAIHSNTTMADCSSLISLLPSALVDAAVRPYIWEGRKAFQLIFAFENLVVLLFLLYLLLRHFKLPAGEKRSVFLFCLSFALLNYLLIGLTVSVLGAIVHYRIVAEMFLVLAVLMATDKINWRHNKLSHQYPLLWRGIKGED